MSGAPRPLEFARSVARNTVQRLKTLGIPDAELRRWAGSLEFDLQENTEEKLTFVAADRTHQAKTAEEYAGKSYIVYWDMEWQDTRFVVLDVTIVEARPKIPKNDT